MTPDQIFSSMFQELADNSIIENYPDIFKQLFLELSEKVEENSIDLKLLLIVTCKATLQEKMQQFKVLICAPERAGKQAELESIERSRTQEIFYKLFALCSVKLLKKIQESGYKMTKNE